MYLRRVNSWSFEGALRIEILFTKEHKDSLGEFPTKLYYTENKITVRNIAKFSRGGIYKPSLQAEILQNYQEVEFINHHYRQKSCKIKKRWNL